MMCRANTYLRYSVQYLVTFVTARQNNNRAIDRSGRTQAVQSPWSPTGPRKGRLPKKSSTCMPWLVGLRGVPTWRDDRRTSCRNSGDVNASPDIWCVYWYSILLPPSVFWRPANRATTITLILRHSRSRSIRVIQGICKGGNGNPASKIQSIRGSAIPARLRWREGSRGSSG
ncbi:hypothetical protein BO82DRAFT_78457 [Aspergillus uvarum CBS 121591]|uniref:Uncharacterized protein n=1 Tax=Aspergillus uvarum CBS 121591 TaxID=1448315 RepID=A0A319CDF7_9EURO|nr:hypothetical protein BO82DRAFT_78457 [Aspergillus uvarum CBS 121591]PYH81711.1 hypothetical protein BO82DRAFT_78457 [Aspergillus uvarum CBS 121591]